jgi:glyoxylase-like metal-dependent hydrolase (beta-lactamase superfamily II)
VNGVGSWLERGRMVCHTLLVETPRDGLVLIESGLSVDDVRRARERLGLGFLALLAPKLDESQCAVRRVEALGHSARDVRHVILTHMDPDHAGGIRDFPHAKVHVHSSEHADATSSRGLKERYRYNPRQWEHTADFVLYRDGGEPFLSFPNAMPLEGLPPELLMIPLRGHSRGHALVGVYSGDRWLLHAGDAYFHRGTIDATRVPQPLGSKLIEALDATDYGAVRANHARLAALRENADVRIFCAHDADELDACQRGTPLT